MDNTVLANYSAEIHAIIRIQWGLILLLMVCTGYGLMLYFTERMERRRAVGYLRQARRDIIRQKEKIASLERLVKKTPVPSPPTLTQVASPQD